MEGRRGRGRQREPMIDSLAAWMDIDKTASAISAAKDRAVWKDMMANALGQGEEEEEDLITALPYTEAQAICLLLTDIYLQLYIKTA